MNCDVTVKASDFSKIHNALWHIQYNNGNVTEQIEVIRAALQDAYAQEDKASRIKSDHYGQVKKELGLDAIWSIYEVNNLSDTHTYQGVTTVTYKNHWGERGDVVVPVNGLTWAALYVAANAAIRESGDEHHVFIEGFQQVDDTLILVTGS